MSADRMDLSALLRRVVDQTIAGKTEFQLSELEKELNSVREALDKPQLQGGMARDAVQRVCRGTKLNVKHSPTSWHYVKSIRGKWKPKPALWANWRYLHSHSFEQILLAARRGHFVHNLFLPRVSYLPNLRFDLIQSGSHGVRKLQGKKGLYIANYSTKNYVGQTDEILTRWREHLKKGAKALLFASLEVEDEISFDELFVAEALAIRSFSEFLYMRSARSKDKEPTKRILREGSALALSFQAGVINWCSTNLLSHLHYR